MEIRRKPQLRIIPNIQDFFFKWKVLELRKVFLVGWIDLAFLNEYLHDLKSYVVTVATMQS